jgi:AcrR family transcriptional regulator
LTRTPSKKKRTRTAGGRVRAAVAPAGRASRRNAVDEKPLPPITVRGNRTRDRLKDAAAKVLERVGYRAMRLADIADEADVNVSLFYHYFSGKSDITREILTELLDSRLTTGEVAGERSRDAFDTIVEANLITVETYADTPGLMRCLLHFDEEEAEFSRLYRKVSLDWNRRVARAIAKRCPDAPLSEAQRLMIAYALGGMIDNFLFEMYVDRNQLLIDAFKGTRDVAVFLAILWFRALYCADPPAEKLGAFRGMAELRLIRP